MVFDKIFGALALTTGSGKSSGGTAFEMIAVLVLTILIAYIVGLMISHIVDRKLGDIQIQMPKINVNAPERENFDNETTKRGHNPQMELHESDDWKGKIKYKK